MKISCQWLRDYCDSGLEADELADCLSQRGVEIEAVTAVGDDFCLDLDVTANRPDLLSHIGIAREVAAAVGLPLRIPRVELQESERPVAGLARVEVHNPDLCPRYTARVLYDVSVAPAPAAMQRRLEVVGLRPINNIVDITNYVLMECGQPEHAFDLGCLVGGVVIVRPAVAGERLALIDGAECTLSPEHLVIADARRPVALAGIMGGLDTEIEETTQAVLLESALFDRVSIRRSTRTTGKSSDSSYRFERGVDLPGVEWASRRAAALMQQHAGAKLAAGLIDINFTREEAHTVHLRMARIEKVLGMSVSLVEAGKLLKGIGFGVKAIGHDALAATVPSFRNDVRLEIDLIEEVARCHGYDKVPTVAHLPIVPVADSKAAVAAQRARETLIRLGYFETVTTTFVANDLGPAFSPWASEDPVRISNPLRSDEACLRPCLVPSLLQVKRNNQDHGVATVRIFELGRVYLSRSGDARLPDEKTCLALLADEGFHHLKGVAEAVFDQLGLAGRCSIEPFGHDLLSAGAAAAWRLGQRVVGYVGEIADEAAARFGLRNSPCVCELDLDALVVNAAFDRRFRELPRFPSVERDLAIVADEATTWQQIVAAVEGAGAEHLESVAFDEIYRGEQVDPGKKSILFTITYRAPDRTLTNDEVNASQERVVAALAQQLGATLRA